MAVIITASRLVQGATELNDTLAGAGSPEGGDLGSVQNGAYAPIASQSLNTGEYQIYFRHDGVIDRITNVVTFIDEYGVGSGNTYGGAKNPAQDISDLLALGLASDGNKNNTEDPPLGGGLRIDMNASAAALNKFDYDANGLGQGGNDTVGIYGKDDGGGNFGSSLSGGFVAKSNGMVYDGGGNVQAIPSAPVDGEIGRSGDQTEREAIGSDFRANLRIYLPSTYPDGGIGQVDYYLGYSFTA